MIETIILEKINCQDEEDILKALIAIENIERISFEEAESLALLIIPHLKAQDPRLKNKATAGFSRLKNLFPQLDIPPERFDSSFGLEKIIKEFAVDHKNKETIGIKANWYWLFIFIFLIGLGVWGYKKKQVQEPFAESKKENSQPTEKSELSKPSEKAKENKGVVAANDGPQLGTLLIRSFPENCEVFVDGMFVDTTPLKLKNIPGKRINLTLKKSGFWDLEKDLEVGSENIVWYEHLRPVKDGTITKMTPTSVEERPQPVIIPMKSASPTEDVKGVVWGKRINVREGPNIKLPVKKQLNDGITINIKNIFNNGWILFLDESGKEYYVWGSFVITSKSLFSNALCKEKANIFLKPEERSKVLKTIEAGERVLLTKDFVNKNWGKVVFPDTTTGFISLTKVELRR